jgi:hypothetical protein
MVHSQSGGYGLDVRGRLVICCAARVRIWPVCDLPECPRKVGCQGRSGLVLLTQSLAGVDPKRRFAAVNCSGARASFLLDVGPARRVAGAEVAVTPHRSRSLSLSMQHVLDAKTHTVQQPDRNACVPWMPVPCHNAVPGAIPVPGPAMGATTMRKILLSLAVLSAILLPALCAAPAQAYYQTFVTRSGNDANACSMAQPCQTFSRALS